ncbi:MAG: hypothetical protein LBE35_03950 [Clostridiales bacterium]|nr:hypothetical protein [Clostridiales bacterium]
MSEMVVDFKDIQETLEPVFGGRAVRIILIGDEVRILPDIVPKRVLKARGILHDPNRPPISREEEKRAVGEAIVENYLRKKSRST